MKKTHVAIQLHRPSVNELLFFVLSGAIVSVPLTLFIEQNLTNPLLSGLSPFNITLITVAVFAPFVEEFSKGFPLFYRHGETQRSIFNLALCVGIGFGIVEFITYIAVFGPEIVPNRIPGLLFHPASTSITAYGIATRKPLPYYLAAVSLHFANNFFAVITPGVLPFSVIILLATCLASWRLHTKTKEKFVETDYATVQAETS